MPGTRLGAVPHPCTEPSTWVLLVEGPPDMISAPSRGLPAIAVPGDHAWEGEWAQLLAGRRVSIVMDCDDPGREAARRITGDLKDIGVSGSIIDLDPRRQDGYDLTDWLADRERLTLDGLRVQLGAATGTQGDGLSLVSGPCVFRPLAARRLRLRLPCCLGMADGYSCRHCGG